MILNKRFTLYPLFFLFISSLAGCASIPKPPAVSATIPQTEAPPITRKLDVKKISSWQISGKIAVQTTKDSGTASVFWQQNYNKFLITLSGPLGAGGFKLTGSNHQVRLQMSNGKIFTASSPEQLLAQQWGFNLPVSNLRYWIRGLPVPNLPALKQFNNGRLTRLNQQGWQVDFLGFTHVDNVDLPARLAIYSSSLKIKIVIYQWQVL